MDDRGDRRLLTLLRSDVDRYSYMLELDGTAALPRETALTSALRALAMCPGLRAVVVHRLGHALVTWSPASPVGRAARLAGRLGHFAANRWVEITTGISIAERAHVGRGFYIGHFGGVIVGAATLGDHCTISQGVTIGRSGRAGEEELPRIGDRVWIGPGAVVAGAVTVGRDAIVGANAVVTRPVPPRSSALGAPARIHHGPGSFGMVVYRGVELDGGRATSLREHAATTAATAATTTAATVPA
jgi:serine O-acetyltransferase